MIDGWKVASVLNWTQSDQFADNSLSFQIFFLINKWYFCVAIGKICFPKYLPIRLRLFYWPLPWDLKRSNLLPHRFVEFFRRLELCILRECWENFGKAKENHNLCFTRFQCSKICSGSYEFFRPPEICSPFFGKLFLFFY